LLATRFLRARRFDFASFFLTFLLYIMKLLVMVKRGMAVFLEKEEKKKEKRKS
jgi:hypothetical protein